MTTLVVATTAHVFYRHRRRGELVRPSIVLLLLVAVQITLGALTVLSGRHHIINSLHVVTGGAVLVTSLVLALRAWRPRFADAPSGPAAEASARRRPLADRPAGARA